MPPRPLPKNGKAQAPTSPPKTPPKTPPRKRGATPTPPLIHDLAAPILAPKSTARSREETPRWARGELAETSHALARSEPTPKTTATMGTSAKPRARVVRAAMAVRRFTRAALGPIVGVSVAAGVAFAEGKRLAPGEEFAIPLAVVSAAFGARLLARLVQRVRTAPGETRPFDFELSMLLSSGALALSTHLPDGLDGAGYAGVYVALALTATFAARGTAWAAAIGTLGAEIAMRAIAHDSQGIRGVVPHALVIAVFVALNGVVLRGRIEQISARARRRVEREVERMREQARSYRLHDATTARPIDPSDPRDLRDARGDARADPTRESDRTARSGVEEIQIAVRFALDLLKRSLGAHTAILLFETAGGADDKPVLKLAEVVSDAKTIAEGPFGMGDGVLGAVVRRRAIVSLHGLRTGYRVPYYPTALGDGSPTSIVAAPILEGGAVRGVLCVDRLPHPPTHENDAPTDRPFSAHEEELVAAAARYVLRAIENERVFGRLERAKAEQDQLYAAAQRLSGALTETEVLEAGVASARAIAAFDLAAITIVHEAHGEGPAARTHEVRAVAGAADFESLVGLRFGDNGGLVAQAVKSRATLPHRGDHDPATQVVFTRRHPLRVELENEERGDVRSILVVPLTLRERVLGTLVLGARRRGAFREFSGSAGSRTTLEVLASHIATSLANARMVAKLEELATTDGLTGLLNKRVLLTLGVEKVRAAVRYGKALSVIQTDIDHFKLVNDTHGHDVGDQVIKGLAGILRRLKRGTDYVARFGGEEFVVICEETDSAGAYNLAERVREELARTTFHAPSGPFQVTCSLGVATYPQDGTTWEQLYKATDDALYASKRSGRNRTTMHSDLVAARSA